MVNESKVVSKAEAARRWSVSAPVLTKYIRKGMPARADGKLDWERVAAWRVNTISPEKSGSWKARQRATPVPVPVAVDDFSAGFVAGFMHARQGLRKGVPGIIATMEPKFAGPRIAVFAIVDHLLGAWLDDPANQTESLPPIDWRQFTAGTTPKAAKAFFDGLQSELAAISAQAASEQ